MKKGMLASDQRLNVDTLMKKAVIGILLGCLVTTSIIFVADWKNLLQSVYRVDAGTLATALLCAIGVYVGRFLKWAMFLRVLNIHVLWKENVCIFLSGLALGITPGKIGEVLKCYILKKKHQMDFSYTAPTIVGERLSGVLGCFLLCLFAAHVDGEASWRIWELGAALVCIVMPILAILHSATLRNRMFHGLCRIKMLEKHMEKCRSFYNSTVELMGFRPLLAALLISVGYWFLECMIFYSLLCGFGISMEMFHAVLLLTAISIGGGLTLLPGSIGALEGGLIGILTYYGADVATAGGLTLLHRFFAMWSVVLIGWCVLIYNRKNFGLMFEHPRDGGVE